MGKPRSLTPIRKAIPFSLVLKLAAQPFSLARANAFFRLSTCLFLWSVAVFARTDRLADTCAYPKVERHNKVSTVSTLLLHMVALLHNRRLTTPAKGIKYKGFGYT